MSERGRGEVEEEEEEEEEEEGEEENSFHYWVTIIRAISDIFIELTSSRLIYQKWASGFVKERRKKK